MKILLLLAIFCLFIFRLTSKIDQYNNFLEVPEELYKHMINKSNIFIISVAKNETSGVSSQIRVGVTKSETDGKYYFFAGDDVNYYDVYLIGYYILKDI